MKLVEEVAGGRIWDCRADGGSLISGPKGPAFNSHARKGVVVIVLIRL